MSANPCLLSLTEKYFVSYSLQFKLGNVTNGRRLVSWTLKLTRLLNIQNAAVSLYSFPLKKFIFARKIWKKIYFLNFFFRWKWILYSFLLIHIGYRCACTRVSEYKVWCNVSIVIPFFYIISLCPHLMNQKEKKKLEWRDKRQVD